MIILSATNQSLELLNSAAGSLDFEAAFADNNDVAKTFLGGSNRANIAAATSTTLVAAPGSNVQRQVKSLYVRNSSLTLANRVTLRTDTAGVKTPFLSVTLAINEVLVYEDGIGFIVLDPNGNPRIPNPDGFTGRLLEFFKVGTAKKAAGAFYSFAKDSGLPGAWLPGTPGLAGRATDGLSVADAGCLSFPDPASGNMFLTNISGSSGVAEQLAFYDILWVNSGLVVTTTTAQTINSVAFPARDVNGAVNGEGLIAGLLCTTATTNAGAITNITMSYTNSDGVSGRTATMASFPISQVIGGLVWFQLQAGDKGIQSIQSVTLGTSLVTGAVSVIVARRLGNVGIQVANLPAQNIYGKPGIRLYNRSTILPFCLASATTASNISGALTVQER